MFHSSIQPSNGSDSDTNGSVCFDRIGGFGGTAHRPTYKPRGDFAAIPSGGEVFFPGNIVSDSVEIMAKLVVELKPH